jgi:iron complex transport system permease protein
VREVQSHFGLLAGLSALLFISAFLSLSIGFAPIPVLEAWAGLFGDVENSAVALIVQEVRLPRVLVGILVGASLGASGAVLQGLLRNPLADPGVIGVSASAGLGAVIAIYYGAAAVFSLAVPVFAMVGALLSTALLYFLARRDTSVLTLILIGIGINSLASALTSLAMNLSPNPFFLSEMVMWLLGSLENRSMTDIQLTGPTMIVGWVCLLFVAPSLRALTLGEDVAQTLGVNLRVTRLLSIVGSALAVGSAVAIAGAVAFVGLIVPHMMRPLVGQDPARLLIPSALGGAILISVADMAIRLAPLHAELKLGVLTALIGGPFFLYLVISTRRSMR